MYRYHIHACVVSQWVLGTEPGVILRGNTCSQLLSQPLRDILSKEKSVLLWENQDQ